MATAPKSVEIRSFQVGFGDCFLSPSSIGDRTSATC